MTDPTPVQMLALECLYVGQRALVGKAQLRGVTKILRTLHRRRRLEPAERVRLVAAQDAEREILAAIADWTERLHKLHEQIGAATEKPTESQARRESRGDAGARDE